MAVYDTFEINQLKITFIIYICVNIKTLKLFT